MNSALGGNKQGRAKEACQSVECNLSGSKHLSDKVPFARRLGRGGVSYSDHPGEEYSRQREQKMQRL